MPTTLSLSYFLFVIKSEYQNKKTVAHMKTISLRSMAVLSSRAHDRRSREKNKLLPPQSPRGFFAFARLYYLARPTKTAMLRRLEDH